MEPFDQELEQAFRRSMGDAPDVSPALGLVQARARRAHRRRAVGRAVGGAGAVLLLLAGTIWLARPAERETVSIATVPTTPAPSTSVFATTSVEPGATSTAATAATTIATAPTAPTTPAPTVTAQATAAPTAEPSRPTTAPTPTAAPTPPPTAAPSASASGRCGSATGVLQGGVIRVTASPAPGCAVREQEEGPTESKVRLEGALGTTKIEFRLVGGQVVASVEEEDAGSHEDAPGDGSEDSGSD